MIYYIVLILIIVGMGVWIWYLLKNKKENKGEAVLEKHNEEMQARKKEAEDKIMALFVSREKIDNGDVQELLKISQSSATRYLDDLEAEGKIRQVGKTGKYVFYAKI